MNSHALYDAVNDSIRAGIVWIQAETQAQMVGQELGEHDLERAPQRIHKVWSERRHCVVE